MKTNVKKKSYEIDMCHGPLFGKILLFSVPLMLSGILQLLFNAADIVVVGRFAGSDALAAVGATSSLIILLTNVFIGLSVGANVLVSRYYGGKQEDDVSETVHTAILLSLICGVVLSAVGILLARPLLRLMGTPVEVLEQSVLYMRIYFVGMPVSLLYNFGGSVLRAIGDTKRPLYYLTFAGIVNVVLNLFFVIVFHMGVAGVALATIISQGISAICVMICLMKSDGCIRLNPRKLHIYKSKLINIIKIGLPAGMQGAIFSFSNVVIQSSINSFGALAVAGNTASVTIEGFIYAAMNAMHQTTVTFTGQNLGGKQFVRIRNVMLEALSIVTVVGLVTGCGAALLGTKILGIYSSDPEVLRFGLLRLGIVGATHFLCGIMDTLVGGIRGLGYSVLPMIVSLIGVCGFRILWIFTLFQRDPTLYNLYLSYPISWGITLAVQAVCFIYVFHHAQKTIIY